MYFDASIGRIDNPNASLEDIEKDSVSINEFQFPGIYFLLKDNQVVYVGQSTNILYRLSNHVSYKDFDSISWIPCHKAELNNLEAEFIVKFKPDLNASMPSNDRYWPASKSLKIIREKYEITFNLKDFYKLNVKPCVQLRQSIYMSDSLSLIDYYDANEVIIAFESIFFDQSIRSTRSMVRGGIKK